MLATFCLRLALGLIVPLPLLPARQLHPKFFRTQFLTALGLIVVAGVSSWGEWEQTWRVAIGLAMMTTLVGSVVWSLEPPPYGKFTLVATIGLLAGATLHPIVHGVPSHGIPPALDAWTSALLLGGALTAMLVGHSYLISAGMTLAPLNRMLYLLFAAIAARTAVSGLSWWLWTRDDLEHNLTSESTYWLPVRWLVGLAGPTVFGVMAWLTARIRSTQSATGILYVVVICVFLGELIALLLHRSTGYPL